MQVGSLRGSLYALPMAASQEGVAGALPASEGEASGAELAGAFAAEAAASMQVCCYQEV